MRHENRTFTNETIHIDGNQYDRCVFQHCTVVFSATNPVELTNCEFGNCKWSFGGPAALTVDFMAAIYAMGGGARELMEATFNNIRQGRMPHLPETAN